MTRFKITTSFCLGSFALLTLTALPACGPDKDGSETRGSSSTSGDDSTTMQEIPTTSSPTDPTTSTTGEPTTSGSVSDSADDTTTEDTNATTMAMCADSMPVANGGGCMDASGCGCESTKCFTIPIVGGFCGECLGDADCNGGGCTVPNPFAMVGSTCNMGEPGAGCQTDAVCQDKDNDKCGTLLEVPGIFAVATCGECVTNDDCTDMALPNCSPTFDVMNVSGKFVCVADGSVPNDTGCNLAKDDMGEPTGNKACMSGFCGVATIEQIVKVGICGECNSDADCEAMGMTTCNDATVDTMSGTTTGATCS